MDSDQWSLDEGEAEQFRRQQVKQAAINCLEQAKSKQVAFGARSNVHYDPHTDLESNDPVLVHELALSFRSREFLHIVEKYNHNWWIGRLVKEDCGLGFIPSPVKLENLRLKQAALRGNNLCFEDSDYYDDYNNTITLNIANNNNHHQPGHRRARLAIGLGFQCRDKMDHLPPYDIVPTVRPLVLIGPSLKGFQVTDMMQKVIFDFLKHRFVDRIIITRVTADISLEHKATSSKCHSASPISGSISKPRDRSPLDLSEVSAEIERVFELAHAMQLMALDCDTINHPTQVAGSSLAPIVIYLKVSSLKVLKKLIKSHGKIHSRQLGMQMDFAEKLTQLSRESFDVILEETQLEEACEHLAEYLESYWKAIHPIGYYKDERIEVNNIQSINLGNECRLAGQKNHLSPKR